MLNCQVLPLSALNTVYIQKCYTGAQDKRSTGCDAWRLLQSDISENCCGHSAVYSNSLCTDTKLQRLFLRSYVDTLGNFCGCDFSGSLNVQDPACNCLIVQHKQDELTLLGPTFLSLFSASSASSQLLSSGSNTWSKAGDNVLPCGYFLLTSYLQERPTINKGQWLTL